MKLQDALHEKPAGKGCQPKTEKQARQWAEYDAIAKAWRFPKPLSYSLIEKLNIALTGVPRGIPLQIWLDTIKEMNELQDLVNPYGYLRFLLTKKMGTTSR